MSENIHTHETRTDEPSAAEILKQNIDSLFSKYSDDVKRGVVARAHEEILALDLPAGFTETPLADRVVVTRAIPGEEDEARERWTEFSGSRVSMTENVGNGGSIQTDFRVNGDDVLRRQRITMPGTKGPLEGEPESVAIERLERGSSELLGDMLSVAALSGMARIREAQRRNSGEVADPNTVKELVEWLAGATPAKLRY